MEPRKSSIFAQLLRSYDARETKVSYLHWFIKKMNNNPQTHPNKNFILRARSDVVAGCGKL